jgi:lipopolysaccharide transport system permease protein
MDPNAPQPTSLLHLAKTMWRYKDLIGQITKRNIASRYRGSALGLSWSLLNPLIMLSVFTFVFSVVFKSRWGLEGGGEGESQGMFAIILFIGLILHSLLTEVIIGAPNAITHNANYVKKVVFPLEILPIAILAAALFHAMMSFTIWFAAYSLVVGEIDWGMLLLPAAVIPFVVFLLGVAYMLAALGAYIRDISQIMGVASTVLLFLSPIFFPLERLPEGIRSLAMLNPLSLIIEQARNVLIWHQSPDFLGLAMYGVFSLVLLKLGFWWFQVCRRGFADVL